MSVKWKEDYILINNKKIKAICPEIISASRATDIPAFYSDWFINNFKRGYINWKNPFNGKEIFVSFKNTRIIVFWSKNPEPMIDKLKYFDDLKINYYFLITLNDYEREGLEPHIPELKERIEIFIKLSKLAGKEKVLWRFDPVLLGENLNIDEVLNRIKKIGDIIHLYTEKLIIGFVDILKYKKVQRNLKIAGKDNYRELTRYEMEEVADGLQKINKNWGLNIATCSEPVDLSKYNIKYNKCIDDELMRRIFSEDKTLMEFLNQKNLKDSGQRKDCGCIKSKDIGVYDSCKHGCVYCYASRITI
jgi:DNA repair photolyase